MKEARCTGSVFCDPISMTFWKRQSYQDIKQINGCSCLREGACLTSQGLHQGVPRAAELLSVLLCWWIRESRHCQNPQNHLPRVNFAVCKPKTEEKTSASPPQDPRNGSVPGQVNSCHERMTRHHGARKGREDGGPCGSGGRLRLS